MKSIFSKIINTYNIVAYIWKIERLICKFKAYGETSKEDIRNTISCELHDTFRNNLFDCVVSKLSLSFLIVFYNVIDEELNTRGYCFVTELDFEDSEDDYEQVSRN